MIIYYENRAVQEIMCKHIAGPQTTIRRTRSPYRITKAKTHKHNRIFHISGICGAAMVIRARISVKSALQTYTPVFFLINTQSNNTDGDMKIQGSIPVTHSTGPEFKSRSGDQPFRGPSSAPPITRGTVLQNKLLSLHSATFQMACSLITPPPRSTSIGLPSLLTHTGVILLSSQLPCLSRSTRARICMPVSWSGVTYTAQ